ncbi:MAG: MmcQ/YjbR family DNA-binding protein [Candidatus Eiseniibacteriota bacterium]
MSRTDPTLTKLQAICLGLPDTKLTMTWGKPHFRVAEKIFCGYGEEGGKLVIGMKLAMEHAAARVAHDPRFTRAPYVGHKGWVSMDATKVKNWTEVADLVLESYRLIASKKSLARLEGGVPAQAKVTAKRRVKRAGSGAARRS